MTAHLTTELDSEYQRRDQLLRDSELQLILDSALDAVITMNADGLIAGWNKQAETVFGWTGQEAIGQTLAGLIIPPQYQVAHLRGLQHYLATGEGPVLNRRVELSALHRDGHEFPIELAISPLKTGDIFTFSAFVRDITDRNEAEQSVGRRAVEFKALYETARDLAGKQDVTSLLQTIIERARDLLAVSSGSIYVYDAAQGDLELALDQGTSSLIGSRLALGEGAAGRAAQTRQALVVNDYANWEGRAAQFSSISLNAILCVPMLYSGQLIGVLSMTALVGITRQFGDADVQLLSLFAGQAAGALYNARMLEQARRRADQLQTLNHVGNLITGTLELGPLLRKIVTAVRAELDLYYVTIGLLEGDEIVFLDGDSVESVKPGDRSSDRLKISQESISSWVASTGTTFLAPDVGAEPRYRRVAVFPRVKSELAVALKTQSGVIGVLDTGSDRLNAFTPEHVSLIEALASQIAVAIEKARMLEQARRRTDQLQTLNQVGQYITGTLELGPLLRQVVTVMRATLDLYYVIIGLIEGDQICLQDGDSSELIQPEILTSRRLKFATDSISAWVVSTGMSFLAPDVDAEPRYRAVVELPRVKSELVVPLKVHDRVIGVLDTASDRLNAFTPEHVSLVEALASQIAVAIQSARLFEETRQRLAELEAVSQVSAALRAAQTLDEMLPMLLDVTLEVMHATRGSIWLYDAGKDELRAAVARGYSPEAADSPLPREKPGEGIAGYVFASEQPYIAAEFRAEPRLSDSTRKRIPPGVGGAGVPIRAADKVIGAFLVNVPLPRQVTPAEVRLLTTLSEIAGNAIQRTTLRQQRTTLRLQTERRLRYLTALGEIDRVISSSFDLHLSLTVLLGHVTAQLGVDAADVLLFNAGSQMLEYGAARGFHGRAIERTRVRIGEGMAGRAVLEHRLIKVIDEKDSQSQGLGSMQRTGALAGENFVAYFCVPLMAKGKVKGVLEAYKRTPLEPDEEWLDFLKSLAERAAIAIDNITLFDGLQRSNNELVLAYDATIEGWSRAIDMRDKETERHSQHAADITVSLARAFGLSEDELVQVRWGVLLHDIGNMGIPDNILQKAGPLTVDEWVVMKTHPSLAFEMLSPIRYLHSALDIPYRHHEKWDGTGYPRALKGEQIPLAARIFAVVDVWDALSSDRPYRKAWPEAQVLAHLSAGAGTHFDPQVVRMFLEMHSKQQAEPYGK